LRDWPQGSVKPHGPEPPCRRQSSASPNAEHASIKEAPTDRRPGLGLRTHHLVPPCGWDGGVNGSVLGAGFFGRMSNRAGHCLAATRWALLPSLLSCPAIDVKLGVVCVPEAEISRILIVGVRVGRLPASVPVGLRRRSTRRPQHQSGCEDSGDLANHIVLLILIPESCRPF
jgi:hypothetical protein